MRNADNTVESLASALYHALAVGLQPVKYQRRVPSQSYKKDGVHGQGAMIEDERRPRTHEVAVDHFMQSWGSTALGFDGIGGQAITHAYTTVVATTQEVAVYFDGRLAYCLNKTNNNFREDLKNRQLASVRQALIRYTERDEIGADFPYQVSPK